MHGRMNDEKYNIICSCVLVLWTAPGDDRPLLGSIRRPA